MGVDLANEILKKGLKETEINMHFMILLGMFVKRK